jgi:hypothetical protein
MVRSSATEYRLEERMDQPHPTTNHLMSLKRTESNIHIANKERTLHQTRNKVFYQMSHIPCENTSTFEREKNTRRILTA